jgi:hypothetical protein
MLLWMAHLFIKQVMARAGANVLIQELAKEVTDLLLVIAQATKMGSMNNLKPRLKKETQELLDKMNELIDSLPD